TLRGAIDWSYELLDEPARTLLARLSVFAGGCSLEAAEAVCDATLDGLESLIEKNLLRQEEGLGGEPRFTMLETIREYAAERLEERPDADETRRRHLGYFVDWYTQRKESRLGDPPLVGDYERDEQEHENAQVALAFAQGSGAADAELRLCDGVSMFWRVRGLFDHGRSRLEAALARATDAPAEHRAWALTDLAHMSWPIGRWDDAYRLGNEAVELFDRLDDDRGRAFASNTLGIAADGLGRTEEAVRFYEDAEEAFRRAGAVHALGVVLNNRGYSLLMQGRPGPAEAILREADGLFPNDGSIVLNLGLAAFQQGRVDEAAAGYIRGLRIGLEGGNPEIQFYGLEGLACVAAARGEHAMAARLWGASETLRESINAPLQGGERLTHDEQVARSRDELGADALNAAWAEGRAMDAEAATALALSLA
ncbi:MAG TPA: tetratricopeptide repeat protein, partial [Gaiellaceae bacterium]|nr:tetratricopeptide repeat protein [Gaiellaceae bacterium]